MNSEVEDEEEKAVDKKKGKKKQPPQELVEKPYEIEDIEDDYKDEFDEWFFIYRIRIMNFISFIFRIHSNIQKKIQFIEMQRHRYSSKKIQFIEIQRRRLSCWEERPLENYRIEERGMFIVIGNVVYWRKASSWKAVRPMLMKGDMNQPMSDCKE